MNQPFDVTFNGHMVVVNSSLDPLEVLVFCKCGQHATKRNTKLNVGLSIEHQTIWALDTVEINCPAGLTGFVHWAPNVYETFKAQFRGDKRYIK